MIVGTVLASLAMVVIMQLSQAQPAQAGTFGFCENVELPGNGSSCVTSGVVLTYEDYGWGDNHSVCVKISPYNWTLACSGGPGQGVYSGTIEENYGYAYIENHAAGSNRVHGVYFN
jgi:hypothetical protein